MSTKRPSSASSIPRQTSSGMSGFSRRRNSRSIALTFLGQWRTRVFFSTSARSPGGSDSSCSMTSCALTFLLMHKNRIQASPERAAIQQFSFWQRMGRTRGRTSSTSPHFLARSGTRGTSSFRAQEVANYNNDLLRRGGCIGDILPKSVRGQTAPFPV